MQLQSISSQSPNVISITQIRQDIDVLTDLLEKYPVVRVLRGQEILFDALRLETDEEKRRKISLAVEGIRQIRNSFKRSRRNFSDLVIRERDHILNGKNG